MHRGYIKVFRKLKDWCWYDDHNTKILFLHLLLSANHSAKNWHGIQVNPGQLVTGRKELAAETGLTEQQIRTSMERLKSTSEITSETTNKYSIVTICNWRSYQGEGIQNNQQDNQQDNQQSTSNQPAINQQSTTTKECKNARNARNEENVKTTGGQDDLGLPPELDRYGLPMTYDLDEVAREIYKEYPRKDGITASVKKIKKAFTLIHPIVLYRLVRAYGMLVDQSEERKQFIPMCTTWMNQCKWEADAPIANPPKYVYDPAYEAGDEMWQIEQHKQRVQQFRVDREEGLKAWNEAKALLERMQDDAR